MWIHHQLKNRHSELSGALTYCSEGVEVLKDPLAVWVQVQAQPSVEQELEEVVKDVGFTHTVPPFPNRNGQSARHH